MKNFFSYDSIAEKSTLMAKRFPVSVLLLMGFAFWLFLFVHNMPEKVPLKLGIFFSFGVIISTAAALYLEDYFAPLKQYIINAALIALWGTYCFFLPDLDNIHIDKITELAAIGAAAFLSIFFISFLRKDKDEAFWNFAMRSFWRFGLACNFGVIIYGGLFIAVWATVALFDIKMFKTIYDDLAIVCFALFIPLYFLANIPGKIDKYDEEIDFKHYKHLKIFALHILTPLAAVYAVILYAYLFKIIFTWELPNGWVSWLMSILACTGLLIITLLHPNYTEAKNKFIVFLSRYFGLIILPLLVLMTIGIIRRINDYGITINRCYMGLLNIWFYGIYIYLFIAKRQSIKWIPVSASAVFLLASIGFWSIPNITYRVLTGELNEYLGSQKITPSDSSFFDNLEQKDKILEKIEYLEDSYGIESVQPFFDSEITYKTIRELKYQIHINRDYFSYNAYNKWHNEIHHIENFNSFVVMKYNSKKNVSYEGLNYSFENGILSIKINPDRLFTIPLREMALSSIEERKEYSAANKMEVFQGSGYAVLIDQLTGYYHKGKDSISVNYFGGMLFYNE